MSKAEMTPEAETELVIKLMLEKGVPDPGLLGDIVPVWAIGMANGAWRNTIIEEWHAGSGPLSDGDMLRLNSYTTHGLQQRLRGWLRECELDAADDTAELDDLDPEDVDALVDLLYTWLTRPERRLPTGVTLSQLAESAESTIEEYGEDADQALGGFLDMAYERGPAFAFLRTAAHGAAACPHWWNHPRWPAHVDAFIAELRDPGNEHLGRLSQRPSAIGDLDALRSVLLTRPWDLDSESAQWIIDAGLRYVQPQLPVDVATHTGHSKRALEGTK